MKLKRIVERTNFHQVTPLDSSELITELKREIGYVIVSLVVAEITVTSEMLIMAANKNLLGLLKLIPYVTEQLAADIIDGSIIGFNLQEGLFDEAVDSAKELKADMLRSKED